MIVRDSDDEADTVGRALKSQVKGFAGLGRYPVLQSVVNSWSSYLPFFVKIFPSSC